MRKDKEDEQDEHYRGEWEATANGTQKGRTSSAKEARSAARALAMRMPAGRASAYCNVRLLLSANSITPLPSCAGPLAAVLHLCVSHLIRGSVVLLTCARGKSEG